MGCSGVYLLAHGNKELLLPCAMNEVEYGLFYNRGIDHLAVCTEGVIGYGKNAIILRNIVLSVANDLTGGSGVVVCAVNEHQTAVGLDVIHIVPQLAVLVSADTVLEFNLRLVGINHGSIDHLTVCAEGVVGYGENVVRFGDIILSAAYDLAGGSSVVVCAVNQNETGVIGHTVLNIVHTVNFGDDDAVILLRLTGILLIPV